jgi:hypothetical protein
LGNQADRFPGYYFSTGGHRKFRVSRLFITAGEILTPLASSDPAGTAFASTAAKITAANKIIPA